MAHRITIDDLQFQSPREPMHDPRCGINVRYKTLPDYIDCPEKGAYSRPGFEDQAVGSSSVKHLYSGIGNYYPVQRIRRPVNTMYGMDLSQFAVNGKRISYHYKSYPLTNRHVRETREYTSGPLLPYMDTKEWTRHPVDTDVGVGRWY